MGTANPSRPVDKTDLRKRLSPEQYHVTQRCGTEPPFSGIYWNHKGEGVYRCVVCDVDLFPSETKFDSGTGWPSFYAAADKSRIRELVDESHGMRRIEVRCRACDAHLGHLFPDGPDPTGERYCINSAALRFEERKRP